MLFSRRFPFGLVLIAGTIACVGCGKSHGTLSGTVKMDDKLVVTGSILIVAKEGGATAQGVISPDGTYKVDDVPFGLVQIAVISPDPNATPVSKLRPEAVKKLEGKGWKGPTQTENSKWFAIPENYTGAETSGLTVQMDQKQKKHDIVLKGPPPE